MAEGRRERRAPILGVLAYLLVSGERRRRASGHFRRAGFEVLKGVGELARADGRPRGLGPETERRESIDIE